MITEPVDALKILRSVNTIDSSIIGIGVDVFSLRILVRSELSYTHEALGFESDAYLEFTFHHLSHLKINLEVANVIKPLLADGSFATTEISTFETQEIFVEEVGKGPINPTSSGEYEIREIFEARLVLNNGVVSFRFMGLGVRQISLDSIES